MSAEGAEGYGGGAVEAAYCPPVDWHIEEIVSWWFKKGIVFDIESVVGWIQVD